MLSKDKGHPAWGGLSRYCVKRCRPESRQSRPRARSARRSTVMEVPKSTHPDPHPSDRACGDAGMCRHAASTFAGRWAVPVSQTIRRGRRGGALVVFIGSPSNPGRSPCLRSRDDYVEVRTTRQPTRAHPPRGGAATPGVSRRSPRCRSWSDRVCTHGRWRPSPLGRPLATVTSFVCASWVILGWLLGELHCATYRIPEAPLTL